MQKRIDFAFNIFGGIVALLVLLFVISSVIAQFQKKIIAVNGNQTNVPASGSQSGDRLIAFTSEQDGNAEIYTVHADGSVLTNLTNNPAHDSNPVWSPDGKRILFASDRPGISQIYMMNADGSNVFQLTHEDAEHSLLPTGDPRLNLWSPDGNRFLFVQKEPDQKTSHLYALDINDGNRILLASDARNLDTFSWSPNGEYVGYVVWDEVQPGGFVPNLYIVDAAGNNSQELSTYLSQDEHIFTPYFWASDGRSIIFPVSVYAENRETIYQLDPQEHALHALMSTKPMLYEWYGGIALGIDSNKPSQPLVWQRPDGTSAELDLMKGANPASCYIGKARSLQGNLVIGGYCKKDNNLSLYWTNRDGSKIQRLPDVRVPVVNGGLTNLTLSPDEKFLTFNFNDENETNLYIWDVEEALENPASQPTQVFIGGDFYFHPAWQPVAPVANEDITEKSPTPEPEKTLSHDGLIVFTSEQNGNYEIYTVRSDGSDVRNITNNSARDMDPVWSPDGKHIAFLSDDRSGSGSLQIYSMNSDGTNLIRLTNTPDTEWWAGLDWSPDGQYLVAQHFPIESEQTTPGPGHTNIYLIHANGSGATQLTENESGGDHSPKWSPKGDLIAFLHAESNSTQIYTIHPDGTGRFKLSNSERNDTAFNWSPDGSRINYISSPMNCFPPDKCPMNEIWSVRADGTERVKLLALPVPEGTLDQIDWVPDRIDWSPDGTRLIVVSWDSPPGSAGNSYLSILSPFNNSDIIHRKLPGHIAVTSWSPDSLFFTYSSDVSGNWDIYTLRVRDVLQNLDVEPFQITSSPSADTSPAWQPMLSEDHTETQPTPGPEKSLTYDGLIVFTKQEGNNTDIYTIHTNGNDLKRLTNSPWADSEPMWSPDGTRIAFEGLDIHSASKNIYIMDSDGNNKHTLTTEPGFNSFPVWSPDGQKIVYKSSPTGNPNIGDLYVMNADGSNKVKISEGQGVFVFRSWSPDNNKIIYVRQKPSNSSVTETALYTVNVDGTNRHELSAGSFVDFIVWEDNEHFLVSGWNGNEEQAKWLLQRFDTIGSSPVELASHTSPIVAIFENTYVVEEPDALRWFTLKDNSSSSPSWKLSSVCQTPSDWFMQETIHNISPNGNYDLVSVDCLEGTRFFFLMNWNGTQIQQLNMPAANPSQAFSMQWSLDGKYGIMTMTSGAEAGTDLYLLDIQKMLNTPSMQPVQLTTDGEMKYNATFQPTR